MGKKRDGSTSSTKTSLLWGRVLIVGDEAESASGEVCRRLGVKPKGRYFSRVVSSQDSFPEIHLTFLVAEECSSESRTRDHPTLCPGSQALLRTASATTAVIVSHRFPVSSQADRVKKRLEEVIGDLLIAQARTKARPIPLIFLGIGGAAAEARFQSASRFAASLCEDRRYVSFAGSFFASRITKGQEAIKGATRALMTALCTPPSPQGAPVSSASSSSSLFSSTSSNSVSAQQDQAKSIPPYAEVRLTTRQSDFLLTTLPAWRKKHFDDAGIWRLGLAAQRFDAEFPDPVKKRGALDLEFTSVSDGLLMRNLLLWLGEAIEFSSPMGPGSSSPLGRASGALLFDPSVLTDLHVTIKDKLRACDGLRPDVIARAVQAADSNRRRRVLLLAVHLGLVSPAAEDLEHSDDDVEEDGEVDDGMDPDADSETVDEVTPVGVGRRAAQEARAAATGAREATLAAVESGKKPPPRRPASTASPRRVVAAKTCPICGKSFQKASALTQHKQSKHKALHGLRCRLCPSVLTRRERLARHLVVKHNVLEPAKVDELMRLAGQQPISHSTRTYKDNVTDQIEKKLKQLKEAGKAEPATPGAAGERGAPEHGSAAPARRGAHEAAGDMPQFRASSSPSPQPPYQQPYAASGSVAGVMAGSQHVVGGAGAGVGMLHNPQQMIASFPLLSSPSPVPSPGHSPSGPSPSGRSPRLSPAPSGAMDSSGGFVHGDLGFTGEAYDFALAGGGHGGASTIAGYASTPIKLEEPAAHAAQSPVMAHQNQHAHAQHAPPPAQSHQHQHAPPHHQPVYQHHHGHYPAHTRYASSPLHDMSGGHPSPSPSDATASTAHVTPLATMTPGVPSPIHPSSLPPSDPSQRPVSLPTSASVPASGFMNSPGYLSPGASSLGTSDSPALETPPYAGATEHPGAHAQHQLRQMPPQQYPHPIAQAHMAPVMNVDDYGDSDTHYAASQGSATAHGYHSSELPGLPQLMDANMEYSAGASDPPRYMNTDSMFGQDPAWSTIGEYDARFMEALGGGFPGSMIGSIPVRREVEPLPYYEGQEASFFSGPSAANAAV